MVGVVAALCWGGGFLVGGVGIDLHWLWLLYLGYGVLGGVLAWGSATSRPVSTLIRWFPDRRGMAAGLAIMGFGGGALIAAPMNEALDPSLLRTRPTYLGKADQVCPHVPKTVGDWPEVDGTQQEVVVIGPREIKEHDPYPGPEGVYLVGTGRTGIAATFFVLSGLYTAVMLVAAFAYRIPAVGWQPAGWDRKSCGKEKTQTR